MNHSDRPAAEATPRIHRVDPSALVRTAPDGQRLLHLGSSSPGAPSAIAVPDDEIAPDVVILTTDSGVTRRWERRQGDEYVQTPDPSGRGRLWP